MSNIQKLIDHLKSCTDLGFNMNYLHATDAPPFLSIDDHSGHNCGTVACLAGHIYHMCPELEGGEWDAPAEWLGLSSLDAYRLFFGIIPDRPEEGVPLTDITLEQALIVLEHLKATGEVRWDLILQN